MTDIHKVERESMSEEEAGKKEEEKGEVAPKIKEEGKEKEEGEENNSCLSAETNKNEYSGKKVIKLKMKWCDQNESFTLPPPKKEKLDTVILLPHYQHIYYQNKNFYIPLEYNMYLKMWKESAKSDTICIYIDEYETKDTTKVMYAFYSHLPRTEDNNTKFFIDEYEFDLGRDLIDDSLWLIINFEHLSYVFAYVLFMIYTDF